jgi:hypothetical protein
MRTPRPVLCLARYAVVAATIAVQFATFPAGSVLGNVGRAAPPVPAPSGSPADLPVPDAQKPVYENSYAKDFIMDAPWRVMDANTPIPLTIILKDCDVDDIRQLHWIRCWDVSGGGNTLLWDHSFGDERIGDDATEANYWTYITTVTEGHPSLPNGTLLTPTNLGYGPGAAIQLKVSIYYKDDIFNYTETKYLRVRVGGGPFPWPSGWYGGDCHFHTMYTNNLAESGAPVPAVRRAAAAMGLQWLLATDHSCDLDETGDGSYSYATQQWEYTLQTPSGIQTFTRNNGVYGSMWNSLGADLGDAQGADLRLVRGEEVNLASIDSDTPGKTLHAIFGNSDYISSPWSGSIGEQPVSPSVPDGVNQVTAGGFVFAAHPLYDLGAAVNGAKWGDEDIATALGFPAFLGIEAFNSREVLRSTNETNPWADFDGGSPADRPYPTELLEGITLWDDLLRANLGSGSKVFLAGGSDAHGDFNYATYLSLDSYATDNAIGKVQTVAHVPGPYAPGNLPPAGEIMNAIRLGRIVATDGPFVEIGVDRDYDGDWYETGDLQIGDDGTATTGTWLPLRVRWASLSEFGPITSIKVYVGDAAQTNPLLQIDPSAPGQGYSGEATLDLGIHFFVGPRYFRAECLTADGGAGHRAYANPIWITFEEATEVAGPGGMESFALGPCIPNPVRSEVRIPFSIPVVGRVRLTIHDVAGRSIRTIVDDAEPPVGRRVAAWDTRDDGGRPVPSGIYFCRLALNGRVLTKKLQILR